MNLGLDLYSIIEEAISAIYNWVPQWIKDIMGPFFEIESEEDAQEASRSFVRQILRAHAFDCKTMCTGTRVIWDDWAHGGSRISGPVLTFCGPASKLGVYVNFNLPRNELPTEFRATRGIRSTIGIGMLTRIRSRLAQFQTLLQIPLIEPELRAIRRVVPILDFLQTMADWLKNQDHDWVLCEDEFGEDIDFPIEHCDEVYPGTMP